ncbi:MAG: sodium:solute symporter family protein [Ignavibacteria bacterium]|jgi:SSS family solute:Na+ symporter|nr:sodium:solute symporter family protein [Ignavibacteria bacterium]MCU7503972.1 sodium:solute symporter family protein [Ignavibacteria bacterium]MCU7515344.1 sodium:solute symporter family protein [Ignavibacteria bacterium]
MISFSFWDIVIILSFFLIVIVIGFLPEKKETETAEGYLLSGRKVGLFLFILTNVSTWYGGILGVGEFTYRYGISSWFTQGLPYYIFAFFFALFFAKKIRNASLFTIPDKLRDTYGSKVALSSAMLLFILVSPAPYLLMIGSLISMIFKISLFWSLIVATFLSAAYLLKGGYRSDLLTDAFEFFVMFAGFIVILFTAYSSLGNFTFLKTNLPPGHLSLSGGASYTYILVWFLIALWTFTDPGFHQRCYAAKDGNVAVKGIIISIFFWALFDFLTTFTGLYSRAALPDLKTPVLSFPMLAEKLLGPGLKGLFYSAMFATILSTSNSFFFLSATTFGKDFLFSRKKTKDDSSLKKYTVLGLIVSGAVSIALAYLIPSVIDLWYTIGTICIPGIIIPVISAYYPGLRIGSGFALAEIVISCLASLMWYILRAEIADIAFLSEVEPMIAGLAFAVVIHLGGMLFFRTRQSPEVQKAG